MSVKDLYDNAENFDSAVNDRTAEHWNDRLGARRLSWHGLEEAFQRFLLNSGYEDLGEYAAGIEISSRNQIFRKDGELWRANASLDLPYTTSGDWAGESASFVSVGDAALRQELSTAGGAGKSGFSHDQAYPDATVGKKLKQGVSLKDAPFNGIGNGEDSKATDRAALAAMFAYVALTGVPYTIPKGDWDLPNFNAPSSSTGYFEPGARIIPSEFSAPGAIISNASDVNPFRTDVTIYGAWVTGEKLDFTGTTGQQDNGIGFALGATRISIYNSRVENFIANFDGPGPGGKGIGFEEGVLDCLVDGAVIENCTYPLFGSPTLGNPDKNVVNLAFRNITIRRCATVFWALTDAGTATVPTGDSSIFSMSFENIYAEDVGHFPDVNATTGRFEKAGAIILHGASNIFGRNITIFNHADYPSATHPAGGTRYPNGYPAASDNKIGSGLSGPIGAVVWGWGRNIDLEVNFNGPADDTINISYPRAHRANVFGGNLQPVGSSNFNVKVTHTGAKLSLVRSGYVGGHTGALQAGSAFSATFSATASERDGEYAGQNMTITGGTGSGQTRRILTYIGATKIASVSSAFSPAPDATSTYSVAGTTTALADGNMSGILTVLGDAATNNIVQSTARFSTTVALEAYTSSGVKVSGSLFDVFIQGNTYASGASVRGGSWTPTLFNTTNVSASTAFVSNFTRVGNVVQVSGSVSITPAAAGTVDLDFTPPIPGSLVLSTQGGGVFSDQGRESGGIIVDTVNNRLRFRFVAVSTANRVFGFSGSYRIVN